MYEFIENPEWCNFVDEKDVYFINPYKFGDKSYSDFCNEFSKDQNFKYDCIYDEVIENE